MSNNWNWDKQELPFPKKGEKNKEDDKFAKYLMDVNGYHISHHLKFGYYVSQKSPYKCMNFTYDDRGEKMILRFWTIEEATEFADGLDTPTSDLFSKSRRKKA